MARHLQMNHLEQLVADLDTGRVRDGAVRLLKEFFTTETTLARFRDFAFTPRTFDRRSTSSWLASPVPEKAKAWEIAQEKISGYSYELDEERQRELRRIMDSAARQLGA